ncbi:MAG: SDR family oxidoreductase [Chlorobiaceae bacterium]|nr:SDR family oxidoreductase [Chlorobiaceae bacterium]
MSYNPFSLKGKNVLVTGASSGIGRATAIECSRLGAKLIITGRNSERLEETLSLMEDEAHSMVVADLSYSEGLNLLVNALPQLDGVVHSAGVLKRLPLKFVTEENLAELMQINFIIPALLTRHLYKKKILSTDASIVFISSVASSFASLGNIMYMASKGALNSFMKGVALELASSGIRANAIQPGMVKTHLTVLISDSEIEKDIDCYPLGRYGKPEEIACAVVYLLSDATKWMTGTLLTIDGGLTLR